MSNQQVSDGSTVNMGIDDENGSVYVPDVTGKLKDAAQVCILTPLGDPQSPECIWGAPACFWGLPAVAKSDSIKQAAHEAGLAYGVVMPGQRQPEDFSGVLLPDGMGDVKSVCLLGAVRALNHYKRGVLFLDEFANAPPTTQGSMLGMVNDRQVGDTTIEPGVRIMMAANPPEYSAGGFKLDPPMANRVCHLQVRCPPVEQWIKWLIEEGSTKQIDIQHTEDTIRKNWASSYAEIKGLIVGFMHSNQRMLHMEPHPDSGQSGYCWASPRSIWLACRVGAACDALGKPASLKELLVEGCMGKIATDAWMEWQRTSNLPSPEDALEGRWKPDTRRLDVSLAVLTSSIQLTINTEHQNQDLRIKRAKKMWTLLGQYIEANLGDFAIPSAKTLINQGLSTKRCPELQPECEPIFTWMVDHDVIKFARNV